MSEEEINESTEPATDSSEPLADAGEAAAEVVEPTPLEQMTAERDKLKDQLLRTAADFDNFRKRSRKELEQVERRGREDILRELLPIIDNLERAVEASATATDIEGVRDGVTMVLKQFEDICTRIDLSRVPAVGERFDPNLHDAFQQIETADHPPGTVIREYQAGFKLGDKLIRPAMVVVARQPAAPASEEAEGG